MFGTLYLALDMYAADNMSIVLVDSIAQQDAQACNFTASNLDACVTVVGTTIAPSTAYLIRVSSCAGAYGLFWLNWDVIGRWRTSCSLCRLA